MNEIIEGYELVKMYSWELEFYRLILQRRKQEVKSLQKIYNFLTIVRGFFEGNIFISIIAILTPYLMFTDNPIEAEKVFSAIMILYSYSLYGNILFSHGLRGLTSGKVVM